MLDIRVDGRKGAFTVSRQPLAANLQLDWSTNNPCESGFVGTSWFCDRESVPQTIKRFDKGMKVKPWTAGY